MGKNTRMVAAGVAVVLSLMWIGLLSALLESGSRYAALLLDMRSGNDVYPLSIQNMMWVMFFLAMGELLIRARQASQERRQLSAGLLPTDESILFRADDLSTYYSRINETAKPGPYFLQRLLLRAIQQFQISRSVDQANTLMNSSVELYQHEIDLRYNILRYLVWLIPTLGFIGTVVGIADALSGVADGFPSDLSDSALVVAWLAGLTDKLGVAFDTTLLALILSAILVCLMHVIQESEELSLNKAAQFCVDHLINKLYEE